MSVSLGHENYTRIRNCGDQQEVVKIMKLLSNAYFYRSVQKTASKYKMEVHKLTTVTVFAVLIRNSKGLWRHSSSWLYTKKHSVIWLFYYHNPSKPYNDNLWVPELSLCICTEMRDKKKNFRKRSISFQ